MSDLPGERGFALVAAVWLLVVLSIVSLEFSLRAREQHLAAANAIEEERARAAALGGLEHARARLGRMLAEKPERAGSAPAEWLDPWRHADTVLTQPTALDDVRYRLRIRDVGARLNLNLASEAELRRFFVALEVDAAQADEIAQSVLDWRDPDDFRRGRGAERDYYLRRGGAVLPRNAPFASLADLGFVRGMTREVLERATPHLTLAGTGQVNLATADRAVLLALPGMSEEAVGLLLRRRAQGLSASLFDLAPQLSAGARAALQAAMPELFPRTTEETREVEGWSEGWVEGSRVRVRLRALFVRGDLVGAPFPTAG